MPKIITKVSLMTKAYIWLYCILFITFGGITIDSNVKLILNKYLKFYGYLSFTISTTWNFFGFIYFLHSKEMTTIYKSDQKILYYMICLTIISAQIQIAANLWYINLNGFRIFRNFLSTQIVYQEE
jgi:hypothetical protein